MSQLEFVSLSKFKCLEFSSHIFFSTQINLYYNLLFTNVFSSLLPSHKFIHKEKVSPKILFCHNGFFSSTIYFQNIIFSSQFSFLDIFVSFIIITFSTTNLSLSQNFVVPIFSSDFCFHHQFNNNVFLLYKYYYCHHWHECHYYDSNLSNVTLKL